MEWWRSWCSQILNLWYKATPARLFGTQATRPVPPPRSWGLPSRAEETRSPTACDQPTGVARPPPPQSALDRQPTLWRGGGAPAGLAGSRKDGPLWPSDDIGATNEMQCHAISITSFTSLTICFVGSYWSFRFCGYINARCLDFAQLLVELGSAAHMREFHRKRGSEWRWIMLNSSS